MFHLKSTVMVRIITLVILYFVSHFVQAQTVNPVKENILTNITVTVPNVNGIEGEVVFALYDSNENFMQRKPLVSKKATIADAESQIVFENVKPGVYAIVCLHDKNSNNIMDFGTNGMPLEDYGSSNNVIRMGPPNFEDAKFMVENKSLDLTIRF